MLDLLVTVLVLFVYSVLVFSTIYAIYTTITDFGWDFLVATILLVILTLIPVAIFYDDVAKNNAEMTEQMVDVEIVDKAYTPSRLQMIRSGKALVPMTISEKHRITLKSDEHEETLDDRFLYDSLEVGDIIQVNYMYYTDKNGKVIGQKFGLKGAE